MVKRMKIGWGAMVAFALIFAILMSAVAQKKVVESTSLATAHNKIGVEQEQTQHHVLTDQRWFPIVANPSAPNDPKAATITGSPNSTLPSPTECNTPFSGPMCSAQLDVEGIDDTELDAILANISNNTQTYTVQDLIDAGASTSVLSAREFDPDID